MENKGQKKRYSQKGGDESRTIGSIYFNRAKGTGKKYMKITVATAALEHAIVDDRGYATLVAFENGFKETEAHPDYVVYVGEPANGGKRAPGRGRPQPTQKKFAPKQDENVDTEDTSDEDDDSLPF